MPYFDTKTANPDEFQKYAQQAMPTVSQYGGKLLTSARSQLETLEGVWKPKGIGILEFPSVEQAKAWYNSPEYSATKGIRQRASISSIVLVHENASTSLRKA